MDIALAQLVRTHLQRAQRPIHSVIGKAAVLGQPFAQPHDARERVDHDEILVRRARDQEAAIVGAKIDCSIGLLEGFVRGAAPIAVCPLRIATVFAGTALLAASVLVAPCLTLGRRVSGRFASVRRIDIRHARILSLFYNPPFSAEPALRLDQAAIAHKPRTLCKGLWVFRVLAMDGHAKGRSEGGK